METYPSGPITNYGITLLREGIEPQITYTSPDGDVAFYMNGGLAPWPGVTEGAVLEEGMDGLHPIFNHLDHKGARQDGATWTDTVYDPAEMTMRVTLTARTPENFRKLVRRWFGAWDPEKPGRLSWTTPEMGEWWCYPRLFRTPPEKLERGYTRNCKQTFTWSIRNDDAFWRSYDSVSQFRFVYDSAKDSFNRNDAGTLGSNWSQTYSAGAGVCETDGSRVVWTPSGTSARTVVNRWLGSNEVQTVTVNGNPTTWTLQYDGQTTASISHPASAATVQTRLENLSNIGVGDVSVSGADGGPYTITFTGALGKKSIVSLIGTVTSGGTNPYITTAETQPGAPASTTGDNQVISAQIGDIWMWPIPNGCIDLIGRMDTAGTTYVRARIGDGAVTLSRFNSGAETVMKSVPLLLPPLWKEEWSLVCGAVGHARTFKVLRAGFPVLTFKETGTGSAVGASYRGGGFGAKAGAPGIFNPGVQSPPPALDEWSFGDNATITQSGHLTLTNIGDQPASPDLVVYGPGTFYFGNGPDTEPTIEFGPLLDGQVALVKTKPGAKAVYDLTAEPIEDQDLPVFQEFIKRLISLAFNDNVSPLMEWFQSIFGIQPEQGNLYRLLNGRWTRTVPARSISGAPTASSISVKIKDGNANSKVVAALTPMRRWPE